MFWGNVTKLGKFGIQPDEFLWMVRHCRKFSSNSFHGHVFGMLFNKEISFPNDYRLNNMIRLVNAKIVDGYIVNMDEVYKNIGWQRNRSLNWIRECLYEVPLRFAVYAKDIAIRDKSSSGGMSALLAQHFIENGGVVYGAAYSDDFRSVKTIRVDSMNDYFKKISKSKYSFC